MPRGRKRKFKLFAGLKPDMLLSVGAVFLMLLSALSVIAFIFPSYTLNEKLQNFWMGLFGYPALLIPVLLFIFGLLMLPSIKLKLKEPRIVLSLTLLLFVFSGLFHIFVDPEDALDKAEAGKFGGLVGFKIAGLLTNLVSVYGGIAILLFLLSIGFIILFDVSLNTIFAIIIEKAQRIAEFVSNVHDGIATKSSRSEDEEIEISSGSVIADMPIEEKLAGLEADSEDVPIVEVIPSFSEPQSEASLITRHGSGKDGKDLHAPSLLGPGRDRIWQFPPLELLRDYSDIEVDSGDTEARAKKIKEVLKSFGIEVEVEDKKVGPAVTQYALKTEFGTRVAQIASLQNDIAMAIASPTGTVRIEAPIPGKSLIGIEVPNNTRGVVGFKNLITSDPMKALKSKLGIVLGKDVGGRVLSYDTAKMPHMLVAGTTGSGKSIFIHNVIFSILYRATPHEVKFILVDPKRVELIHYQDIPHLITPVVTDMEKAPAVFKWAVNEMDRRYKLLEKARVPNIDAYNEQSGFQAMPYIMIIVDELAEIMLIDANGVEKSIIRLAQLARAVGLHLLLAVQRPSTNIITGAIKANIPCRISFNVASQIDSRVIIDQTGAEKLLGKGDMLFVPPDIAKPIRLQGGFVSSDEIKKLVTFIKEQGMPPAYDEGIIQMTDARQATSVGGGGEVDSLFEEAIEIVTLARKASASLLQRKLSIGYARAARIMDELEMKGIIGPSDGTSKPREVLINNTSGSNTIMPQDESVNSLEQLQ